MKSQPERGPYLGPLLQKIAPTIGAKVFIEPEWNYAGQIVFKNGKKRYYHYNSLDINPLGATEVAVDKDYANYFLKKLGYPIVPGSKTFFSDAWAKAIGSKRTSKAAEVYAKQIGYPVIVKPNSGSQGKGVAKVFNAKELAQALKAIFKHDRIVLVQKPVEGKDYRIVVLDNKVLSAYERMPLSVVGDGRSSVKKLLQNKQTEFIQTGRDTKINFADPRILQKLQRQQLSFSSVLAIGEKIFLLDNANLSTGGDAVDVTKSIHKEFQKIAVNITRDMGLRLCGVDLMISGDITKKPGKYWVLEINAAPGLDHYVKSGKAQEKIVENLYREVLKAMAK